MPTQARSQSGDLFLTNRFALVIDSGPFAGTKVAGFQSISMPEHTIESIEYSEGIFNYSRFYPGRSSFSSITCTRGVVKDNNDLGRWIRRAAEGWNYRGDLSIYHFHRSDVEGRASYSSTSIKPYRRIKLYNCMPIRFKAGSDFDAMAADISIQEIEFQMERFIILDNKGNEISPGGKDG